MQIFSAVLNDESLPLLDQEWAWRSLLATGMQYWALTNSFLSAAVVFDIPLFKEQAFHSPGYVDDLVQDWVTPMHQQWIYKGLTLSKLSAGSW